MLCCIQILQVKMVEQGNFFHKMILIKRTVMMKYNGFLLCVIVVASTVCGVGARQTNRKELGLEQETSIESLSRLSRHIRSAETDEEGALESSEDRTSVGEVPQEQEKSEDKGSGEALSTKSTTINTANETKAEQEDKSLSGVTGKSVVKAEESEVSEGESKQESSLDVEGDEGHEVNVAGDKNSKNATSTTTEESMDKKTTVSVESPLHDGAVLRGFYVFVGVGVIVLIFFAVKGFRIRQHRAARRYKVLPYRDDQEMYPLAADDDEDDEEIFNAIART